VHAPLIQLVLENVEELLDAVLDRYSSNASSALAPTSLRSTTV
jgi:hypothetical protein